MKMELTRSHDSNVVRLENQTTLCSSNVRIACTPCWRWSERNNHFDCGNRCPNWAEFAMISLAQ
jgi:hypothetical protein